MRTLKDLEFYDQQFKNRIHSVREYTPPTCFSSDSLQEDTLVSGEMKKLFDEKLKALRENQIKN